MGTPAALVSAEAALGKGDLKNALTALQDAVKASPADAKLRTFLFQLMCVMGQWERAITQLNVVADMSAAALPMKQMYGDAIQCEALRAKVFAGEKAPMVFGYPDPWLAQLIEASLLTGRGEIAAAAAMRQRALDAAPASGGTINGERFEWIADADSRLGPVLEALINNRYYWLPFQNLSKVSIEKPEDLRDSVWMPAHLEFTNGGESIALIPTRYAGSESSEDDLIRLSRKTVWEERQPNVFCGLGQRLFATDLGEHALMDVREIVFDSLPENLAESGESQQQPN
jgi:type VI secretion system protein ImpE